MDKQEEEEKKIIKRRGVSLPNSSGKKHVPSSECSLLHNSEEDLFKSSLFSRTKERMQHECERDEQKQQQQTRMA